MSQMDEREPGISEKYRILKPHETNAFVRAAAGDLMRSIENVVKPLDPRQRFVAGGRILNLAFGQWYRMALQFAEERIAEAEKAPEGEMNEKQKGATHEKDSD